jgi:SNF2 family DNA or RNA helicase
LLGELQNFKKRFEADILKAAAKDASDQEKAVGEMLAAKLREKIAPYFLRREKKKVFGLDGIGNEDLEGSAGRLLDGLVQVKDERELMEGIKDEDKEVKNESREKGKKKKDLGKLSKKKEFVIWMNLRPNQLKLYEQFLNVSLPVFLYRNGLMLLL